MRHLNALGALLVALAVWDAGRCDAAFIFSFSPNPVVVSGPGPLNVPVDLVITHNGSGLSTISGFTIDIGTPAGVTLLDNLAANDPLDFGFGANIFANSVGFGSLSNIDIGNGGSATVTTLDFRLDDSVLLVSGPLQFTATLFDASRGGLAAVDISSETTVRNGSFDVNVTAVPEPSSMVLVGMAGCGALVRFRKRLCRKALAA